MNHFVNAKAAIERATRASSGSFGRANPAAAFHGTVTCSSLPADNATIPSRTVDKLNGYLDNMAAAETKKQDVLNSLVSNNKWLETTNATTLTEIKTPLTTTENSDRGSASHSLPTAGGGSAISEVATLKR